jgi:hypothetical protein
MLAGAQVLPALATGAGPQEAGSVHSRRAVKNRALVTEMCYNGWAMYPRVFHTTPR